MNGGNSAAFTRPPTAELHIHVEAAIDPTHIMAMSRKNGVPLPYLDEADLRSRYAFRNLQEFLNLHYLNLTVLKTEEDFFQLATGYLDGAVGANVRRAEIFFDAQIHLGNGVQIEALMGGLTAAFGASQESHGISTDLIMCFSRDLGTQAAHEMLTLIMPYRDRIIGVGLDSTEIGFGPELYTEVYARAAAEGLHLVAHAGEEGGPDTVMATIDLLHIKRVDHGVRVMEDPKLVERLRTEQIAVTTCPLSNVALGTIPTLADHPLPRMLAEGLLATVSSDGPPYFGGNVDVNYQAIHDELGMTKNDIHLLARNSFEAAFIAPTDRDRWLGEVDAYFAAAE
ncbi:MAG: adenosine deaminase [Rhodoglobus sp.]|nr:adenosine deaminase [Rhodoglobus sp.]